MIEPLDAFRVASKEIAAKVIDGEAIIINLATGIYYSTAEVGAFAWELAEAGHSFETMVSAIERRFTASPETDIAADLRTFLDQLVKENLIGVTQPSSPTTPTPEVERTAVPYSSPSLNTYRDMDDMLALDPPVPGLEPIPWNDPESKS